MDAMTTSQVARTLETKKLITRTPDQHDTRIKRLTVTRDGTTLAGKAIEQVKAVDHAYFAQAPDHDALLRTLLTLAALPEA